TAQPAASERLDATGFQIGWDHARHRITPPPGHLHQHSPVRQGWAAGHAAFGARALRPTAAVRQWLALRLQAWLQGAEFEDVQLNPAFIARLDADECPVTRVPLMLGTGQADDATLTRLNPAAAYAAGNLASISAQVAQAWAGGDWRLAKAHADQLAEADAPAAVDGLDRAAWRRLAVLASFATPLPHAEAAELPLCVLPPNRVRVITPVQALQVMLPLQFSQAGYARRLLGLAVLMPCSETRQAFQIFMHTLLARRLAAGTTPTPQDLRRAMEDTWCDTLVQRRWQRLATRLTAADCEQLLQRASQRGLVVGGSRWLSRESATEGWAMSAPASRAGDQAVAGSTVARPGKARNRGSQKLAS
ncbi:MAG: hypothetical protein CFE45_24985, partial [Burkholderiales bacterium PBB5]